MAKIHLVADNLQDPIAFITLLKRLTNKSLSEIKANLAKQKPFFEASTSDPETVLIVQEILTFSKKQGIQIKIFKQSGTSHFEISEEAYLNSVKRREETRQQFEEEDERDAF